MTLDQVEIGKPVEITAVAGERGFRRRLLELGLLPGTTVTVLRVAPLGDPVELLARDTRLSIRRREAQELPAASFLEAALTGQLTGLVRDEQRQRLRELLAGLSEEHREVLRLRYVEELSRAEIAGILELPESVVKSRLFEGLKKLRLHTSDL